MDSESRRCQSTFTIEEEEAEIRSLLEASLVRAGFGSTGSTGVVQLQQESIQGRCADENDIAGSRWQRPEVSHCNNVGSGVLTTRDSNISARRTMAAITSQIETQKQSVVPRGRDNRHQRHQRQRGNKDCATKNNAESQVQTKI